MTQGRTPQAPSLRPLAEHGPAELRELVRAARELEPPAGTLERVWERLVEAQATGLDGVWSPDAARLLAAARDAAEPAPGRAQEIWARLEEEALARAGLAEPRRLVDADPSVAPLLAAAARLEPPIGRRTRLRPEPAAAGGWRWAFAVPGAAMAAAALFLLVRPDDAASPAAQVTRPALAVAKKPNDFKDFALIAGHHVSGTGAGVHAVRVPGLGEFVLVGDRARLTVEAADANGARVRLEDGAVAIHAEKRAPGSPLVIAAAGVEAQVVGTIFAVSSDGVASAVDVMEGIVQVRHAGGTLRLTAGHAIAVGPDAASKKARSLANAAALRALTGTSARTLVPPHRTGPALRSPARTPASTATPPRAALAPDPVRAPHAAAPAEKGPRDEAIAALEALGARSVESPEVLRARAREALGRHAWQEAAVALFALSRHDALPPAEQATSLVSVADLFDLQLGRPWAAILLRERFAAGGNPSALGTQFALMLGYFDVGALEEARAAAEQCVRTCADVVRPIAMFVRARVLQEAGDPGLIEAARELREVPGGAAATALHFAERADRFAELGQFARARRSAAFALALAPKGPNAAHLRALLGDR